MVDRSEVAKQSARETPNERRSALLKWLIFGVSLPLLPFGVHALSAWFDHSSENLSLNSLLGDGELLVVSTVIAAAVIGDLLFDFAGRGKERGQVATAWLTTFALLIVIASAIIYSEVTFNNQRGADAVSQAQQNVIAISKGNQEKDFLRAQQAFVVNTEGITSANGRIQALSTPPESQSDVFQIAALGVLKELYSEKAAQAQEQSNDLSIKLNTTQKNTENKLQGSLNGLDSGEKRSAFTSIVMFLLSFLVGIFVFLVPTFWSPERDSEEQAPEPDSPEPDNEEQAPEPDSPEPDNESHSVR